MDSHNQLAVKEGYEILNYEENTLFLKMGMYIYSNQGFSNFGNYMIKLNKFKNELDNLLLEYYCYYDLNYVQEIKSQMEKIVSCMDLFKIDIYQNFLENSPEYTWSVNEYFKVKKSNPDEINPYKNEGLCVSKLQVEWVKINYQMEKYYNSIKEDFNKNLNKTTKPSGILGRIYNAITGIHEHVDINTIVTY